MDEKKIKTLPDYPVLQQVQKALWKIGEVHGAAVMIGAGFSRFAVRATETTPLAPLWSDFKKFMLDELYPNGGGPYDPIVLADEYRAALGPAALENLIRSQVRDGEWAPGEIHQRLLSLPWSDVLTTNWDTLLERSVSSNPDLLYDIVLVPSDIARTRPPRIVKLHGSLPSHRPFIFTREDFRTYSTQFAPFENLARQVLLENELCLLGFSGYDPNFLEWSGWVRDQLGDSARPIRLIGVLDLSDSRRRLLEKRNVTPIDLAPLVKDIPEEDRHLRATKIFLDFLHKARPRTKAEWALTPEEEYPKSDSDPNEQLRSLAEIWKKERKEHPGWLVTPYPFRERLQSNLTKYNQFLEQNLDKVPKSLSVSLVYERIWRGKIAFWPLAGSVEDIAVSTVTNNDDRLLPLQERLLFRVAIVQAARRRRDWEAFEQGIQFLENLNNSDAKVEALYQRCLRARDELDYNFISTHAESITGEDPVWLLRRAALIAELGDPPAAAKLVHEAYREIRKRRAQDRNSLWLLSREAWVLLLVRSASFLSEGQFSDVLPNRSVAYKHAKTNPYDEFQEYESRINEINRQSSETVLERHPQFDAGIYRFEVKLLSSFDLLGSTSTSAYHDLTILGEHVGIPLRLGIVNILRSRITRALQVPRDRSPGNTWLSVRALAVTNGFGLSGDLEFIENRFSSVTVASIPFEILSDVTKQVVGAIKFGKTRFATVQKKNPKDGQNTEWINRVSVLIELLSRLSIRFQGDESLSLLRFGISLAHDPNVREYRLFKSLGNLLRRSLLALEPERHSEVALEVLCLPLPSEKAISDKEDDWPEVTSSLRLRAWETIKGTPGGSSRIEVLIKAVADSSSKQSRENATLRLRLLFNAGVLNSDESKAFGNALWSHLGSDGFPDNTHLPPYYFLELPSPDPNAAQKVFDTSIIKKLAQGELTEDLLWTMFAASFLGKQRQKPYYSLNPEDALCILDHVLNWDRPMLRSIFGPEPDEGNRIAELIGFVLSSAVLPALSLELTGKDRILKLLEITSDGITPELVSALSALVELDETIAEEAIKIIRKGLISRRPYVVKAALRAILWFQGFAKHGIASVPEVLIAETVSICQMRREPGLTLALLCIRPFVKAGVVSELQQHRLVDALEFLGVETNYQNWLDETRRFDVVLVRRDALMLAKTLKDKGIVDPAIDRWIEEGKSDPMPEVRYALSERQND